MGLITYNPTSPGRRQLITTDRSELWKGKPVKTLTEGLSKSGGRNNRRPHRPRIIAAAGTSGPTAWSTSSAPSSTSVGDRRAAGVRSEPHRLDRSDQVRGRRAGLHRRAAAPAAGDKVVSSLQARRREAGQRHAARAHAGRHHRPQRRDEAPQGRPDRAFGRYLCPVCRSRRRLGDPSPQLGRAAPRARLVPRHGRRGVEPGPLQHLDRQGRSQPLARPQAGQPRRDHEPGRSPAWWWRRPHLRWPSPGDARGASRPRARRPEQQGDGQVHRPQRVT